ncbi:MAG: hypothetical protein M0Z29_00635 [Actinomycetota bacterium]|nr:hypothetical protein [Actinomycetota bacterium]
MPRLYAVVHELMAGCGATRVWTVCRCLRELMAGLPAALFDGDIPRPSPSSNSLVGQLPGLLSLYPDLDFGLDQDMVPGPRKAVRVFDAL